MNELCDKKPYIVGFHSVVEGSLQKKYYPAKPQGRISDGFVYILEGKAKYTFSDYELDVSDGNIMFLGKGSEYSIKILSEEYKFIFVDFDFAESVKSEVFGAINSKSAESMFRRMLEKWRQNKPSAKEECMSVLYGVYSEIIRTQRAAYVPASKQRKIDSAVQFISDNFSDEMLTVETVAEKAGMSESHFRRLFKSAYHLSPVRYITLMRIGRAKELIRYTTYPLSHIAIETGFANVYYFSRIFKKDVSIDDH